MALSRAIESRKPPEERICFDPFAEQFLSGKYKLALLARPLRDGIERLIESLFAGHHYYVIARTRYFDDFLQQQLAGEPEQLVILGAGYDSRAYRFRAGTLTQLTRDDTWVQERIEANLLTPEQARRHPFGHLLTQCLGLDDTPTPSILQGEAAIGDVYLLCTDGLSKMVNDEELQQLLVDMKDPQATIDSMIKLANDKGGHDNITAVLVCVRAATEYIRSLSEKKAAN